MSHFKFLNSINMAVYAKMAVVTKVFLLNTETFNKLNIWPITSMNMFAFCEKYNLINSDEKAFINN